MAPQLIIIRGLPGSGKTTMAKAMSASLQIAHFEADMYFTNTITGEYSFDPAKLKDAHNWCEHCVRTELQQGRSVIVSNPFTHLWELDPYIQASNHFKATRTILECKGSWQSIHNIPPDKLFAMAQRWENLPYRGH